jgi:hypothetical protein
VQGAYQSASALIFKGIFTLRKKEALQHSRPVFTRKAGCAPGRERLLQSMAARRALLHILCG